MDDGTVKMMTNFRHRRCLVASVMQIISMSLISRSKTNAGVVEGCIGSHLSLACDETKMINITAVELGYSTGCLWAKCCPKPSSCTSVPDNNHVIEVHSRCNGRQKCVVNAIKGKILCKSRLLGRLQLKDSDFERITYDCKDITNDFTTRTTSKAARDKTRVETSTGENTITPVESNLSKGLLESLNGKGKIIAVVISLIVIITTVVIIIVIIKRLLLVVGNLRNQTLPINAIQEQKMDLCSSLPSEISNENFVKKNTISRQEMPNDVIACSVASKETVTASEGGNLGHSNADTIIKSIRQAAATKSEVGVYSLACGTYGPQQNDSALDEVFDDDDGSAQSKLSGKAVQQYTVVSVRNDDGVLEKNSKKPMASKRQETAASQNKNRPELLHQYANINDFLSNSKINEGDYKNARELENLSSANPVYEPMTAPRSRHVYENESMVTSSVGRELEPENLYCDMRSFAVK